MTDTAHPSVIEPVPTDCDGNVTIGQPVAGRAHVRVFQPTRDDDTRGNWRLTWFPRPSSSANAVYRTRSEADARARQLIADGFDFVMLHASHSPDPFKAHLYDQVASYRSSPHRPETWTSTAFHGAQHEPAAGSPYRANGEINE